ncbi:MAG: aspartate kinase [Clostridia bacterium]
MNVVVQKYGGTSVENKKKLENICNRIISYVERKQKLVIVISAQGNTTDTLIHNALEYSENPNKRDLDMLLCTGEMQTVAYLSMMLNDKGYKSISMTGGQAGIISTSNYGCAKIDTIYTNNIENYLNEDYIVIVAGFQAVDRLGNITTLGRGGSDLSATSLASFLKAKRCEIYTDVDGIFSSDPKVISRAKLLKKVSYDEMLQAATSGAKVLHNRSINIAKKNDLKIVVKNSSNNLQGSFVEKNNILENNEIHFISKKNNMCKISIIGDMIIQNKELLNIVFNKAQELNIQIYMISFSELMLDILIEDENSNLFMNELNNLLIK